MKKILAALAALVCTFAPAQGGNRMVISFPGYDNNVETLRDFPALVVFTNHTGGSAFTFQAHGFADPDGYDLRFTDADGAPLAYEIDTHEQDAALLAWVKIPALKPDGSTFIIASWGDPGNGQLPCTTNGAVWSGDFLLVQHFNEPAGTKSVRDSSGKGNHGKIVFPSGTPANGVVGGAANLTEGNGRNNGIYMDDDNGFAIANNKNRWTISAWFKELKEPGSSGNDWRTLARGPDKWHHVIVNTGNDKLGAHISGDGHIPGGFGAANNPAKTQPDANPDPPTAAAAASAGNVMLPPDSPGVWRHITAVGTGVAPGVNGHGQTEYYIDGSHVGSLTYQCNHPIYAVGFYQGPENPPDPPRTVAAQQFASYLDEFRVAQAARSAYWIRASYQSEMGVPGFAAYEMVEDETLLVVEGSPFGVGNVEPAFGWHNGVAAGSNITASASLWLNAAGDILAVPMRWERYEDGASLPAESGTLNPFPYVHPDPAKEGKIVWYFDISNRLDVVAMPGGRVVADGGWCHESESLWVEVESDGTGVFSGWIGDVPVGEEMSNPLELPGDRPRKVAATFTGVRYVAPAANGGNDSNLGYSFDSPKATVANAVAALGPDGGLVIVSNGWYSLTTQITLNTPVTVRGVTGNPVEVGFQRDWNYSHRMRIFEINHTGARIENVYMRFGNDADGGSNIRVHSGTVSNCVIAASQDTNAHQDGGGAYISGGLVTHCKIINNVICGGQGWNYGAGVKITGGRLEHSLVAGNYSSATGGGNNHAGGVYITGGSVVNCTIADNSSDYYGGIYASSGTVLNTVVAGNRSNMFPTLAVWSGTASVFTNCVTDAAAEINPTCPGYPPPFLLLTDIAGGNYYPAPGSPLIDKGAALANPPALDLLGNPRVQGKAIDIGCVESASDQMAVSFATDVTEGIAPATVVFTASVDGTNGTDAIEFRWDFNSDGAVDLATNVNVFAWVFGSGSHYVTLLATNLTQGGEAAVLARQTPLRCAPPVLHVVGGNPLAAEPFDTWGNAAATIQAAVDYAVNGCEVAITAGVYTVFIPYPGDALEYSAVRVKKALRVRGDDGFPERVVIQPQNAHAGRALLVDHAGAWISGVTLRGGGGDGNADGYGVRFDSRGGTVSNCVIRGNVSEHNGVGAGALLVGAAALLTHCVITNNTMNGDAGSVLRVQSGRVENCLVANNTSGGVFAAVVEISGGAVSHCTLADNATTARGVVYGGGGQVVYCVIAGNTETADGSPAPLFIGTDRVNQCTVDNAMANNTCRVQPAVDIFKHYAGKNYRLGSSSLAINAGPKADPSLYPGVDLDGNPRIQDGKIDHGCYEAKPRGTLLLVK